MDKPEWKSLEPKAELQAELKKAPDLVSVPEPSMALVPNGEPVSQAKCESNSVILGSHDLSTVQSAPFSKLTTYMLENESQIFWLCASALFVVLGIWFHDVHGWFRWTSPIFSICCLLLSFLSPLCCIAVLFCKPNKLEGPVLSLAAFVSLLFWNQVVTVSALMLMPFRFKGANRALGIAILSGLQIGVIFLYPQFAGFVQVKDRLQSRAYDLELCQHKMPLDSSVTLTLQEDIAVGPFLTFAKVHWRMIDSRVPRSVSILPIDATHVAILVDRFSHYHRTVVDLTVKNLPIMIETIPKER